MEYSRHDFRDFPAPRKPQPDRAMEGFVYGVLLGALVWGFFIVASL